MGLDIAGVIAVFKYGLTVAELDDSVGSGPEVPEDEIASATLSGIVSEIAASSPSGVRGTSGGCGLCEGHGG